MWWVFRPTKLRIYDPTGWFVDTDCWNAKRRAAQGPLEREVSRQSFAGSLYVKKGGKRKKKGNKKKSGERENRKKGKKGEK